MQRQNPLAQHPCLLSASSPQGEGRKDKPQKYSPSQLIPSPALAALISGT